MNATINPTQGICGEVNKTIVNATLQWVSLAMLHCSFCGVKISGLVKRVVICVCTEKGGANCDNT